MKRDIPFGESTKSTKRTLYKIGDPFLLYWYKFIQPNKSLLERDLIDEVYAECEKKAVFHTAEVWEDLAREFAAAIPIGGISWKPGQRCWGPGNDGQNMEIDIVAESFDGNALLFGEAKWDESAGAKELLDRLDHRIDAFPKKSNKTIIKCIWLKKKPVRPPGNLTVIAPEDVLSALR